MPGTMFINTAELAALPTSGAAWTRVAATSTADAGTPNLSNIDSIVQTKVLVQALRWARDGGGVGRDAIINKIKAVPGTEAATGQPLNPYRQIGTWIAAADLVDMPGSTVCANGQTFDAWVASLPDKVMNGQTNWNTLRKCARTSGNNWGNCARGSLLAVGLWLGDTALINEVTNYDRRWLGDLSVPNTFTPTGAFSTGWDGPNTSYPTQQGAINPVSSNAALNGANAEDASRGSSAPPLVASGASYSMEALDAMLFGAVLHHHAGKTDVWQWSDSAIRRNAVSINALSDNWSAANHIYWHETPLLNHIYGISLPVKTSDSYGSRAMPYCSDWLVQGNYLRVGTNGGGGGETPIAVPPTVRATATVSAGTVTINAATTSAGTNPIARHLINWGDGITDTLTEPTRSGSHNYASAGNKTITVTAVDTTDLTDVMQLSVSTSSDQPPVAAFTLSATSGPAPLAVTVDSTGSFDPDGTAIARVVDWDDGAVNTSAGITTTHTYTTAGTFSVRLDVTSNGTTRSAVRTVQVTDPAEQVATSQYSMVNGRPVPVLPAYDSTWNGWHVRLGNYRMWVDATGDLRIKNGPPTSDTDGADVGAQPAGSYATTTDLSTGLAGKVDTSTYTAGLAAKANTADLAAVAQTGSYNDLANKPTIPAAPASDAAAETASLRTLGTGATQAAAGNDARLSNARTPTAHTHGVTDLTATGARNATTVLHGDNTWKVPAGGGLTAGVTLRAIWNGTAYVDRSDSTTITSATDRPAGAYFVFLGGPDPNALGLMVDGDEWKDAV